MILEIGAQSHSVPVFFYSILIVVAWCFVDGYLSECWNFVFPYLQLVYTIRCLLQGQREADYSAGDIDENILLELDEVENIQIMADDEFQQQYEGKFM